MTSADEALPPRHNPFAALRKPDFRLFLVARTFSATANTLLQAVMAWQVYEVSGSTLSLGILGLVRFVPALGIRLIGGAVADTFNRKTISWPRRPCLWPAPPSSHSRLSGTG